MNFVHVTVNLKYSVCYNSDTLLGKHAKPNQPTQYVRYNSIFVITVIVITVIVITEFACMYNQCIMGSSRKFGTIFAPLHPIVMIFEAALYTSLPALNFLTYFCTTHKSVPQTKPISIIFFPLEYCLNFWHTFSSFLNSSCTFLYYLRFWHTFLYYIKFWHTFSTLGRL